ncbi:MAG: hypothetical protein WC662_01090 [Candidatus Paceibacterota bacterium]|jgi:hypothetical protein
MIKIQPIVRNIVLGEPEAYFALTNGYMNMSSYAYRVKTEVELLTKKPVTITSLVISLSRLKKEFQKQKPLIQDVSISSITTKLPLSEIVYENTKSFTEKLESLHKNIKISREDFFTTTLGTSELTIVCSSGIIEKIMKHFKEKPKLIIHNLSAIGISFDSKHFNTPNIIFSLLSIVAKAQINLAEIVSTYTELILVIEEKDFGKTVSLFSEFHKKSNIQNSEKGDAKSDGDI